MKKFLYVLTIALGTCFAANAQSNSKSTDAGTSTNVEVRSGGQAVQSDAAAPASGKSTKACCSSKKGSAKAGCSDAKMTDAHCSDKKASTAAAPAIKNEE